MRFNHILSSNFTFTEEEDLLKFRFHILNSSMLIIISMTLLIGTLSALKVNDLGIVQTVANFMHAFCTLFLLWILRFSKTFFRLVAVSLLVISYIAITSALLMVVVDEFRMVWFFVLIFLSFILLGTRGGLVGGFAAMIIIITSNTFFDLNLSPLAINTAIFAIIATVALIRAYSSKVQEYENLMQEKNEYIAELASVDHLTGIMNRRIFNEVSANYVKTADESTNIFLLYLDIDDFKKLNYQHGHKVCDLLLVRFVEVIELLLRKSDTFARIENDHFVILLYKADLDTTMLLAEKILKKVRTILLSHEDDFIKITTSIGISKFQNGEESILSVLQRSQEASQKAKQQGKNQICQN